MTARSFQAGVPVLLLLLVCRVNSEATCRCIPSDSIYLTTASPLTLTTTPVTVSYTTAKVPSSDPAFILLNTSNQLSAAFDSVAFASSTPGYTYNAPSNRFTLPANTTNPQLVIDLLVGPTGGPCRSMPSLEQICISSNCSGCNLDRITVAAATTLVGANSLSQRLIVPTPIVNATLCADRDTISLYGTFRYVVFLSLGSPSPSEPYQFRVGISGNLTNYSCSSRRRRSFDTLDDGLDDGPLSRSRRAVPNDCSCSVGQDPVFPSVRTVLVSFEYTTRMFSSTADYMPLARELYYLIMNAVRNQSLSSLTSVVADLFDIAFGPGAMGIRVTGKMTVRDDMLYSDAYLLNQLRSTVPGFGAAIVNLSLTSRATGGGPTVSTRLPDFAVALICLLSIAALVAALVIVLWRLNLIGQSAVKISSKVTEYMVPDPIIQGSSGSAWRDKMALSSTLDGAVQMPATSYLGLSPEWQNSASADSMTEAHDDAFKIQHI